MSTIRVQPAARLRRDFAVWATAQSPKVRTVAPNTFAVPSEQFTEAPEELLIGALVDGRRFVSPTEDAEQGTPPPGDLLGVAGPLLPEREAVPGEPLPEVPPEAYLPDSVPLDEASDLSDSESEESGWQHVCHCGKPYSSERGLKTHQRRAHSEGA
ncbi:hypothetical protein [Streptomyces parvulus]|uniref:hypothetical protein n=1 Tax=Streptomyces parvulus TaxID=146923 RepID=UPI0038140CF1